MPTRLYFPASTAAPITCNADAGWNYTSEKVERALAIVKGSSAIAAGTQIGPWSNTAGQTALDRAYISVPLAAQTISGTFSMQLMVREYAGTDNVDQVRVVIRIVSGDGATVRHTLYAGNGSTTSEFINNATHRNFTVANALALTSGDALAGDRLCIEVGYRNSTSATTPEASAKWGENATDLPVNNTQTTDGAPWIEFSGTIAWQAITGTATPNLGTLSSAASGTPVVSGSAAPNLGTFTSTAAGSQPVKVRTVPRSVGSWIGATDVGFGGIPLVKLKPQSQSSPESGFSIPHDGHSRAMRHPVFFDRTIRKSGSNSSVPVSISAPC